MENTQWRNTAIVSMVIAALSMIGMVMVYMSSDGVELTPDDKRMLLPENKQIIADYRKRQEDLTLVTEKRIGPVAENTCRNNVRVFRRLGNSDEKLKGFGVYYTDGDIRYYLEQVYPRIRDAQTDSLRRMGFNVDDYDWVIGCYFTEVRDPRDAVVKHDFYFAPVLVHKASKQVMDFFDKVNGRSRYIKDLRVTIPTQTGISSTTITTSMFNTGTMFP